MSTATKLSYLNETKGLIKDAINDLGGEIDNNTTFREYANVLNDIYDNLPKATGTGTSLSLSPTVKGKLELTLNPTELTQDSTPSPSSPQDVHVISGDNSIVVNGKNLFDKNNITTGYYIASDGSLVAQASSWYSNYISVKPSTKYTIQVPSTTIRVAEYNNSKTFIQRLLDTTNLTYTFTTDSNTNYLRISGENTQLDLEQLEIGSTATTYEPYVSQEADIDLDTLEYCKIGNYSDRIFKTSGKNLFDKSTVTSGKYINSSGVITDYYAYSISDYIEIEPSTLYSYQGISDYSEYGAFYDNSKTLISAFQESAVVENQNFTTPSNAKYVRFTLINTNQDINKFQLEKGSKTEYEPYGSNEWYIKKNIGKVVLDGSEDETYSFNSGTTQFYMTKTDFETLTTPRKLNTDAISNYFVFSNSGWVLNKFGFSATGALQIWIDDDTITSTSLFKIWLSTHNTTVYYVLSTPTYTPITGTLATQLENACNKMKSYNGTTNVSQVNDDLAFNLSGSCLQ